MSHRLLLLGVSVVLFACGHGGLPRQLAESAHRDYPACSGSGFQAHVIDARANTWAVDACGVQTTYECPLGPGARWRSCAQVAPPTAGGTSGVVVVTQ